MNSIVKSGAVIDFHVVRDGKVIYEQKKLHNFLIGSSIINANGARFALDSIYSGVPITFKLQSTAVPSIVTAAGSSQFQQVGTIVSRTSGVDPLPAESGSVVWPGAVHGGYIVSLNLAAGTAIMSRAVNVSPTTGMQIYRTRPGGTSYAGSQGQANLNVASYSAGVYSKTLSSQTVINVSSAILVDSIELGLDGYTSSYSRNVFVLPSPVQMYRGDFVFITNFSHNLVFSTYHPVAFSSGHISGLSTSGKYNALMPISFDFGVDESNYRMYFVTTPNAITLPDRPSSTISPSVFTASQTITPTVTNVLPSEANDAVSSSTAVGTITSNLSDVKQVYFGTTSALRYGVEFDTPQTMTAGKVLTLHCTQQIEPFFY